MSIFDRLFSRPMKEWEKEYKAVERQPRYKEKAVEVVAESAEAESTSAYRPYIPSRVRMRELTILPLIVGTILGVIFGASSLYLVLKVGLTVSASIPVAVISITLFRLLNKLGASNTTILENNIVQTAGSAGESIAFGVGVTMPAILILGFDLEIGRVILVSVLGGLLGILMMIPLRRALIVEQHGLLKYPEGTACAEVLKAGATYEDRLAAKGIDPSSENAEAALPEADTSAKTIFTGFGIGLIYKALNVAFHAWKDVPEKIFGAPIDAASISAEISPELLGVGYIIGPAISAIMCGGGALSYLLLIPLIKHFGAAYPNIFPPAATPLSEMGPSQIRSAYVLYIGAGAVTAGGIISLLRSLPTIWSGMKEGMKDLPWNKPAGVVKTAAKARVDDDLPTQFVLGGIIALVAMIMLSPSLNLFLNPLGAILIILFGFLFVTVSSRLTGEVGSSSNPISGMTVATVLFTCLIFVLIGWTGPNYFVTALSIGGIVCIASSNGGTISQDLKTGFLIGATPRKQQIAILIGALASALALGPILLKLNDAATVFVPGTDFEAVSESFYIPYSTLDSYHGIIEPPTGHDYHILHLKEKQLKLEPGDYLVNPHGMVVWRMHENFPAGLHAPADKIEPAKQTLSGVQKIMDDAAYRVWHKTDDVGAPEGKYLIDAEGAARYLVDPGINGTHKYRPDGTSVAKFDAPKATLISYIIKGVLSHKLPWGMVMIGMGIAVLTELCGISSLTFAVGVYLPLSTTTPILAGGMIRWAIDKYLRARWTGEKRTEEEMVAESDRSPGVLMASGYIAGGAIAGVLIAFMAGVLSNFDKSLTDWSEAHNPFFAGPWSDLLAMIPFVILCWLLYLVGKEKWLAAKAATETLDS
jgi:putative OPT family oligopeptide transporter